MGCSDSQGQNVSACAPGMLTDMEVLYHPGVSLAVSREQTEMDQQSVLGKEWDIFTVIPGQKDTLKKPI